MGVSKKLSQDLYTTGQWQGSTPKYAPIKNSLKRKILGFIDRRRWILFSFIKELPINSKVLDWGCGTGYLVLPLKNELQMQAYGCDVAPHPLKLLKKYSEDKQIKIHLKCCGEYKLPYPDAFFDAIVSADVFGHASNPEKSIDELKRVLKDNGILALHSESIHYQERYFYKKIITTLNKDPWAQDVGHINLKTHAKIKELFQKKGFTIEKSLTAAQHLGFVLNGDITWGLKQLPKEKMTTSFRLLSSWHNLLSTPSQSFLFKYLRLFINTLLIAEEHVEMNFFKTLGGSLYLKMRKTPRNL